jgi:hypothetical protein
MFGIESLIKTPSFEKMIIVGKKSLSSPETGKISE